MSKLKPILCLGIILLSILTVTACSGEKTPYDEYNKEGYNVSVKYDANGGFFTTNTEVIVDSYKFSDLKTGANGTKEIALISPDDAVRGSTNAFSVSRSGYFLAGWYQKREPLRDAQGNLLDADGNLASESGKDPAYTYSGRWDFVKDRLGLDANGTYTAENPVLTLYAAWVPEFSFDFYSKKTGEKIGSYIINPLYETELNVPRWNEETGKLDMYHFPKVTEKTFSGVYLSRESDQPITDAVISHPGIFDRETATARDTVMNLYVDLMDGDWYHIYSAGQFVKNASVSGNYILFEDLDFSDAVWPTVLMYGNFTGTIQGNGHTIRNAAVTQDNSSRVYAGLFGQIGENACIENVTFENVTVTLERGTLKPGARFGLLAGTLASSKNLKDVRILNSTLYISSDFTFSSDYEIGLLCGLGPVENVDLSGISCEPINREDSIFRLRVEVDGNAVSVYREDAE